MYSQFEDLNYYIYQSARGAVLDVLIWCLGPYVDEGRDYGPVRVYLARATCGFVRRWLKIED